MSGLELGSVRILGVVHAQDMGAGFISYSLHPGAYFLVYVHQSLHDQVRIFFGLSAHWAGFWFLFCLNLGGIGV